jgi:hypothetical protein
MTMMMLLSDVDDNDDGIRLRAGVLIIGKREEEIWFNGYSPTSPRHVKVTVSVSQGVSRVMPGSSSCWTWAHTHTM